MRKALAILIGLAGVLPSVAAAQARIVDDGPYPLPDIGIRAPGGAAERAGTSWQAPSRTPPRFDPPAWDRSAPDRSAPDRPALARPTSSRPLFDRKDYRNVGGRDDDRAFGSRPAELGDGFNRYPGYRAIGRGGLLPGDWSASWYEMPDYGRYGFARPAPGTRWVRYYDDALLVDRDGRVRDGRYGMDFDRYGERWDRNERGIPVRIGSEYTGGGDGFAREARERDYAQRFDRDGAGEIDYDRDYPYDGRYGGGYIMTETTVTTTTPTVIKRTYYEDAAPPPPRPRARRR